MKRLATLLCCALVFFLALLLGHHNASAANQPNQVYDDIATEVAGHSVTVWCEDDPVNWLNRFPSNPWGMTYLPDLGGSHPEIFLGPVPCAGLGLLVLRRAATNPYGAAAGLEILLHESLHQQGGDYSGPLDGEDSGDRLYEGRAECGALALMPHYLTQLGVPPETVTRVPTTVTSQVAVRHSKAIRDRKGRIWRWQYWTTYTTITETVYHDEVTPNPTYQAIMSAAQAQHDGRALVDSAYGGGC